VVSRNTTHKPEFEIMEAQLAVRFRDARSIKLFFLSQEAETFKKSYVKPSIQRVTLRGHSASDSDTYQLAILKTLAGRKCAPLINEYKRLATAYESIAVPEPDEPLPLVDSVVLADNAISLYNKFIRRDTKMILPNRVDNLIELCHDIISNKFAERLGMVLEGKIELDEERSKPYAYSKWYQDMIKVSGKFETSVAEAILAGGKPPAAVVGVTSARALITRGDIFEITATNSATRTVLIDAKSKDVLVNTLRTWISANVRVILSRETIKAFVTGRLTFAHDYYIGHNSFFRYAKEKYFKVSAGSARGLHTITTTISVVNGRRRTNYRHAFYFDADITGRAISFEETDKNSKDAWIKNLVGQFDGKRITELNKWVAIKESKSINRLNFRKTVEENDFVIFRKLTQGTEFTIDNIEGSLCMMLKTDDYSLPVTYLNPDRISTFTIGYTLTDADLKVAVKAYHKLSEITSNFDKMRIKFWPELNSALDFILVGSTTDTPDYIINKVLNVFIGQTINAVQLDLIRTFLIKNPVFGVAYSASRFTQYLLNLGKRRNHNHSFLCRTAAGTMADQDSEDWDMQSAEEDILMPGKSDPHAFSDIESDDGMNIPDYLAKENDVPDDSQKIFDDYFGDKVSNWADEVTAEEATNHEESGLEVQTVELVDLFEDTDSDFADEIDFVASPDFNRSMVSQNVQVSKSPASETSNKSEHSPKTSAFGILNSLNFDDVFDIEGSDTSDSVTGGDSKPETLNDLFSALMSGNYEKMKDVKDKGLKSEKSGHTVSPTIENARVVISYLKSWIETVGSSLEFDNDGILTKNVSSVTGIYSLMYKLGALDYLNPLEKFYGLDNMKLPVELSALVVVDVIYG